MKHIQETSLKIRHNREVMYEKELFYLYVCSKIYNENGEILL